VNDNYMERYARVFRPTEVKMMLSAFSNMETIHIAAYALLLETIGMPETEFSAFLDYQAMRDKHDYMQTFGVETHADIARTLAMFGAFTEGLQLFASFAMLMNFPRFNKMKGMGQIVSWSVRDESLHCEGMIKLYHAFAKETGCVTKSVADDIVENCRTVVGLEDKFIDLAFEAGEVQGMTPEDIKAYIRFIADWRLRQLDLPELYGVKENPLPGCSRCCRASSTPTSSSARHRVLQGRNPRRLARLRRRLERVRPDARPPRHGERAARRVTGRGAADRPGRPHRARPPLRGGRGVHDAEPAAVRLLSGPDAGFAPGGGPRRVRGGSRSLPAMGSGSWGGGGRRRPAAESSSTCTATPATSGTAPRGWESWAPRASACSPSTTAATEARAAPRARPGLAQDAQAAYAWLRRAAPESRVALFGESLGTGVSVRLADDQPVAGLVLDSPFASVVRLGERSAPWLPVRWLMRERYDSELRIKDVDAPVLIVHCAGDAQIPVSEGRRLFAAAEEPKEMIVLPGCGHIDTWRGAARDRILAAMRSWTAAEAGPSSSPLGEGDRAQRGGRGSQTAPPPHGPPPLSR
jgi:dienelactone hydrolase